MIAETSRQAYEAVKDKFSKRQIQVYNAIDTLGIASNEQIADYLGLPLQSITGRVTELKAYGVIDVEGIGRNRSGHSAKLYSIRGANDKKITDMAHDCEG